LFFHVGLILRSKYTFILCLKSILVFLSRAFWFLVVVDAMGIGVAMVKIVVQDYPRRQIKRTSDYGRFQYKNFEDGKYILTFSRSDYVTQQVTVYVTKGIRTEVRVVLQLLTDSVLETE
jgi:hypothetical protein